MQFRRLMGLVATTVLAAALTSCTGTAGSSPTAPTGSTGTQSAPSIPPGPPVSQARLRFGLATDAGPTGPEIRQIANAVGESPGIILMFKDFTQAPPLAELDEIVREGASPIISWEPWKAGGPVEQPEYTLAKIASGAFDDYLRTWGEALGRWGKPVTVRFAHEMNGNWYPWGQAVNGNRPGEYVAAYRHVHDVVAKAGAANVTWMWAPNVLGSNPDTLASLYPGADYVGSVGVDGYNWGTTQSWSTWELPPALFDRTLASVRAIAAGKPMIIAETGSVDAGGDKGQWVSALIHYLSQQPDIDGFVWLESKQEVDWRLGAAGTAALKQALAARK